jgi:hypothetical protein
MAHQSAAWHRAVASICPPGAIRALCSLLIGFVILSSGGFYSESAQASAHSADCTQADMHVHITGQLYLKAFSGKIPERYVVENNGRVVYLRDLEAVEPQIADYLRRHPDNILNATVTGDSLETKSASSEFRASHVYLLSNPSHDDILSPQARSYIVNAREDQLLPVTIVMREQLDGDLVRRVFSDIPEPQIRKRLLDDQKGLASVTQREVTCLLQNAREHENTEIHVKSLWSPNAISISTTKTTLLSITNLSGIGRIELDESRPALIN